MDLALELATLHHDIELKDALKKKRFDLNYILAKYDERINKLSLEIFDHMEDGFNEEGPPLLSFFPRNLYRRYILAVDRHPFWSYGDWGLMYDFLHFSEWGIFSEYRGYRGDTDPNKMEELFNLIDNDDEMKMYKSSGHFDALMGLTSQYRVLTDRKDKFKESLHDVKKDLDLPSKLRYILRKRKVEDQS